MWYLIISLLVLDIIVRVIGIRARKIQTKKFTRVAEQYEKVHAKLELMDRFKEAEILSKATATTEVPESE